MLGATSKAELKLKEKLQKLTAERSGCLAWDEPRIDETIFPILVTELNKHPEITSLNLSGCRFRDKEACLGQLIYVRYIDISESFISPQSLLAIANNENVQCLTIDGAIFGFSDKVLLAQFVQETKQLSVKLDHYHECVFRKLDLWDALKEHTAKNKEKFEALKANANSKVRPFSSAPASVLHKPAKKDDPQIGGFFSKIGDYFKLSS